jgi:hypothetical protein
MDYYKAHSGIRNGLKNPRVRRFHELGQALGCRAMLIDTELLDCVAGASS